MEYLSIVFQEVYKILFLLVPVLVSVAMIVWLDRRIWAFVQKRQGPNVVGPFGLLQSLADALKYIFKEMIIPSSSNKVIFILAPIVTMTLALIAWAVIPLFPMFVIFFISALAETNRPPFDLPEAEAELVAGYQTEYSGMMYAMFWLGEYANILLMCAMGAILFLGGWMSPIDVYPFTLVPGAIWLILKILLLFILFALVKAIVPRYRYDQLMRLGWKVFLPLSLIWVVLTASYLFYFNLLPVN